MATAIKRRLVDPTLIAIGVAVVVAAIIITIGETLLSLFDSAKDKESLARLELWFALGLTVLVILGCAFLATRPRGSMGILDEDVVIGNREFFAPPLPPVDVAARNGPLGTVEDIDEGYMLYARNGALARVLGRIGGSNDYGKRFQGFLYAQGVYGASDELWIPFEAVMTVYPQTKSAFLAIKGDETEHFGWNRPPENLRRGPANGREHA